MAMDTPYAPSMVETFEIEASSASLYCLRLAKAMVEGRVLPIETKMEFDDLTGRHKIDVRLVALTEAFSKEGYDKVRDFMNILADAREEMY